MSLERIALWLDHASIQVPELPTAVKHLHRIGLRATESPAAPERHSRVYLDRSYLEVSADPGSSGWAAPLFFLRFEDPVWLRAHLDRVGFTSRFGTYEGVDGTWDDVEVGGWSVPLPILVRRTAPAEIAHWWPPPLREPHRCGATSLAEVHVGVSALEPAVEAYARLLGPREGPSPTADVPTGRRRAVLPAASGRIVLLEGGADAVEGIVLGVGSMTRMQEELGRHVIRDQDDPVAWLDPAVTFGLRLGFVEA